MSTITKEQKINQQTSFRLSATQETSN